MDNGGDRMSNIQDKMKQALWYAPLDVRIEEVPIPEIGPDDVLIKTRVSLTCGTDVKTYRRGHPQVKAPAPFGHEVAGDIVKVGSNVEKFRVGMRVVTHNTAPCGECFFCKENRPQLCKDTAWISGGHSEYVRVPGPIVRQNMFEIPDDVPYKMAALTEPFSCAVSGVERTPIELGDIVAVNGAGPLGLMIAALLKIKGCTVIQCDASDERLEIAKGFGVDHVININDVEDQVQAVKALTPYNMGVDVAFEVVGHPKIWEMTVEMVRNGGYANLFGGCKENTRFSIDTARIHYDEVTVFGIFHTTPKYVKLANDLICSGKIDLSPIITREMPFDDLMKAIELHGNQDGLKNALIYD